MSLNRRQFIKLTGLGMGGVLLSSGCGPGLGAQEFENHPAALYDTTKCIGCRACQHACRDWNKTTVEPDPTGLYDAPEDLSGDTWTLIKLYQGEGERSFVKLQCMHCLEPACASACIVGALHKTAEGPVVYDAHRCIGCRYCMAACPFRIPRYEWDAPRPFVQKCTFCADRQAQDLEPACIAACPTGALVFGTRGELVAEAHRRIQADPGTYEDHLYGEAEVGGTSWLYLSHVPFKALAFPTLPTESATHASEAAMIATPGVIVGAVAVLSTIRWLTGRRQELGSTVPGKEE